MAKKFIFGFADYVIKISTSQNNKTLKYKTKKAILENLKALNQIYVTGCTRPGRSF
jgi:hypothetical protein